MPGVSQLASKNACAQTAMCYMLASQGDLPAKISAATVGKLKTCAICGGEGHNKATCPTVPANAARLAATAARQQRRCSLCGQLGHRRDACPQAAVRCSESQIGLPMDECGSGCSSCICWLLLSLSEMRRVKPVGSSATGTSSSPTL